MKNCWEGRARPSIKHITALFDNELLGAYLAGHLVLESILVIMLEVKPCEVDKGDYFEWSFYRKVTVSKERNLIGAGMADFLLEVNKVRNRLAHRLDTPISFDEAFFLAQKASDGGVEFTDDTIHRDREKSEEWYGLHGVIQEVFQNTAQDLLFMLESIDHITSFVSGDQS